MSDIHGCLFTFQNMLKTIKFCDEDTVYIIGDIVDRGNGSIELLKYCMCKSNIILIRGNHEQMMVDAIKILRNTKGGSTVTKEDIAIVYDWYNNGGVLTHDKFKLETKTSQNQILKYVENLIDYKSLEIEGKQYLLIHAGIYIPEDKRLLKELDLQSLLDANIKKELHLYVRAGFLDSKYNIEQITTIFGHTLTYQLPKYIPTMNKSNRKRCESYKIYKSKYKIGIDCGAIKRDGQLACLCLNDMKEYYLRINKNDKKVID